MRTELVGPLKAKLNETTSRKLVGRLPNVSDGRTSSKAYIAKDDRSLPNRRTRSSISNDRTVRRLLPRAEIENCSLGQQ